MDIKKLQAQIEADFDAEVLPGLKGIYPKTFSFH